MFRISVRINGASAPDVLLHNSTAFSFRVPTHMIMNSNLMDTSVVDISVGHKKHSSIPLKVLESALISVEIDEYKDKVARQRLGMATTSSTSDEHDQHVVADNEPGEHGDAARNDPFSFLEGQTTGVDDLVHEDSAVEGEHKEKRDLDALISKVEGLLESESRLDGKMARLLLTQAVEEGDVRAMTMLATASFSGTALGIPRNVTLGVDLIRRASDRGYPDAQAMLGFLFASGIAGDAVQKDIGTALLLWSIAAEGGSMYAKMAIAYRHLSGSDLQEDCTKASEYYKHVATEVFKGEQANARKQSADKQLQGKDGDSLPQIRSPIPTAIRTAERRRLSEEITQRVLGEANDHVQYYRHMADRGHSAAQVYLGNLYFHGALGIQPDLEKARALFQKGAAKGRIEAHAHLGFMYLRFGWHDQAVWHLQEAADGGDRLGYHGMGFVTLRGLGVEKDPEKAFEYFKKAAAKEYPEAMFNLAIMQMTGVGTSQSFDRAFNYFGGAAKYGHLQSNFYLGQMFLNGIHPARKTCSKASEYFKLVAEQGVWNQVFSKAYRAYERGDYGSALFWYLFAAHAGLELAQYNAGFMYERNSLTNPAGIGPISWNSKSNGVEKSYGDRADVVEEALELYQMSGSQGYSDSMVRVGDLVFREAQDYTRAASAYERAVKQNNPEAMFNLGWMHARGFGMNSDKHMAKRYFDQAKETDSDAIIPATIALFALKYFALLADHLSRMRSYLGQTSTARERFHSPALWKTFKFKIASLDVLLLSALLCALIWVIRKRQERLGFIDLRRGRVDGEENREGDAPAVAVPHLHLD